MKERADFKTRWKGEGEGLAKVVPIATRYPLEIDKILRALPNRSEKIREWVIEGMRREKLL